MFNKVFCIGFNKTGTSSMHALFTLHGLRSWHGYYSHIPVDDPIFRAYDCFSDGNRHDFALLDRAFPGSKFIVTTRPLHDWLVSRIRHIDKRRRFGATGPMREEYEDHPGRAVRKWIRERLDHHQRIRDYFAKRDQDLLVINVCDKSAAARAPDQIATFLGLPRRPGTVMPHRNANDEAEGALRARAAIKEEVNAAFVALGLDQRAQRSIFP